MPFSLKAHGYELASGELVPWNTSTVSFCRAELVKGLRDGGSLLRVSTVCVRPSITSLSALNETFPLNDSIVRACRNTGKSILRFCSISSGKSSAMNKFDPFKFPFLEQMLSRSLIENLAIIGLFWPLTYFPFRWHFNICIFMNSGSIFSKILKTCVAQSLSVSFRCSSTPKNNKFSRLE